MKQVAEDRAIFNGSSPLDNPVAKKNDAQQVRNYTQVSNVGQLPNRIPA